MKRPRSYAKQRKQFGKAISEFQAIQFKLADMATEIDAARWLVYRAAWLADQKGPRFTKESSMAKLYASEVGVRVANEAVQIFGGYGFVKDYPAEKFYRDSKLCTIGEGTSEIQRMVIARQILDSKYAHALIRFSCAACPGLDVSQCLNSLDIFRASLILLRIARSYHDSESALAGRGQHSLRFCDAWRLTKFRATHVRH